MSIERLSAHRVSLGAIQIASFIGPRFQSVRLIVKFSDIQSEYDIRGYSWNEIGRGPVTENMAGQPLIRVSKLGDISDRVFAIERKPTYFLLCFAILGVELDICVGKFLQLLFGRFQRLHDLLARTEKGLSMNNPFNRFFYVLPDLCACEL